ncbi:MAG: glutathione-dependent formaldehyde dehydrogenase [Candidatus Rokubacteria bacterium]|nr:glutathione-dependent formaldehyde dehydrogenase [Candidatus Rokubacteria bacterium]
MKATCWFDTGDVRVEQVPDPAARNPRDAVIRVTSTAICGSDLHLYNGFVPTMQAGDILGHEFMGEIVEVGEAITNIRVGDRVVAAFPIACGGCFFCKRETYSLCENSNPNAWMAEKMWGHSPCGIFGYSHMLGGYAGGQAQYVRVPYADVGTLKVPEGLTDEQVLFLSDILPTGWMGAEQGNIQPGDVVAVWGCGPVGQFAIVSAYLLGAERVIAIDRFPSRLELARARAGADVINYEETDVHAALLEATGGRGPDVCIDAVGLEAHAPMAIHAYDRMKQAMMLESDRPFALRQAIMACRNGGTVSVAGVYGGLIDKFPMGAVVNKALTIRSGQTHVQRYWRMLLERIERREIDPTFIITHRLPLDEAPRAYEMFLRKEDDCEKVVLKP